MNYDKQARIVGWYQELGTMVKEANKLQGLISSMRAQAQLHSDNKENLAQITKSKEEMTKALDKVTAIACEKGNRTNLASAEELLGQIEARLGQLDELQREVRTAEAQFELAVAMGEFDNGAPGMTRADAEKQIGAMRARADKQLELVDQLVPVKQSLVIV